MTMEAVARALGALERNPAVCAQLLAPLERMTALQVITSAIPLPCMLGLKMPGLNTCSC